MDELIEELLSYSNEILGRADSPVNSPYLSLMEVAGAYFARACEIEMHIFTGEHNGTIQRNDPHYKFRTGQLRSFKEMSKMMAEMGSRRLTQEQLISAQRLDIGEAYL